jgi:hypothetical protein
MKSNEMCSKAPVKVTACVRINAEYEYDRYEDKYKKEYDDSTLEDMYRNIDKTQLDVLAHEFSKHIVITFLPDENRYELTCKEQP